MDFLTNIGLFALLFFILVFVHELGHFLMARLMGIRVERFAIGMGPSILSFKRGHTEYLIGILPLGGYVKMAGDDPAKAYTDEEKKIGFLTQKPPAKLLVVFGGPVFNLILPIFLFGILLAAGVPTVQPVVGTIEPGMPAETAGLEAGDRILTVDGQPIPTFTEFEKKIEGSANQDLRVELERLNVETGQRDLKEIHITPKLAAAKSKFGEDIQVGRVGVSPDYLIPQIFFTDPQSLLAKAGFEKFDRVTDVNGTQILALDQFTKILSHLPKGEVTFGIDRDGKHLQKTLEIPESNFPVATRIGFVPALLVLGHIEPNSPAEKAGLKTGDLLVSINGEKLKLWEDVAKLIRGSEGKPVDIIVNREGKELPIKVVPEKTKIKDPLMGRDNPLSREEAYRVGIGPAARTEPLIVIERSFNPLLMIKRGFTESWKMTSVTVIGLYKLFSGQLSVRLLGSPIMIYKVASNSYRMAGGGYLGWFSFFTNLAVLSITLGLVNLLPVPVLDGGHATFFFIELIRGRPVSVRAMEIASQVGLFMLICLFVLTIYNDFFRYEWFESIMKLFH